MKRFIDKPFKMVLKVVMHLCDKANCVFGLVFTKI